METGRFIGDEGAFPPATERLYVGSPVCPAWLEDAEGLASIARPLTVAVPPLTQKWFARFTEWLERFAEKSPAEDVEIGCSDWGTLCWTGRKIRERRAGWRLAAGPLFAPQETDPLLARFMEPTENVPVWADGVPAELVWRAPTPEMVEHWRMPSVFSLIDQLRSAGAVRMELFAQPFPLPEKAPELPVSVYLSTVLTVLPCGNCGACSKCAGFGERAGIPLERRNNAVCWRPKTALPSWVDRAVEW